jgi:cell division protein FtsQ
MRPVNRLSRRLRGAIRRDRERPWRRRAGRAVLFALALVLTLGSSWWVGQSGMAARIGAALEAGFDRLARATGFVVREVTVEGRVRTDPRELAEVLESRIGTPILSVELDNVRKQLEGLPWVKFAAVRRQLPGTLHAVIEEHRPLALWREKQGARTRLIDEEGDIVPVADLRPFTGLPLLIGEGAPRDAARFLKLLASEPAIAKRTTVASFVGGRRWNLYVDGRIEVRLPAESEAAALRRLASEDRANRLLDRAVEAIDLRSADWIVVRTIEPPAKKSTVSGGRGA